jgi:hypothetical protein
MVLVEIHEPLFDGRLGRVAFHDGRIRNNFQLKDKDILSTKFLSESSARINPMKYIYIQTCV